VWSLHNQPHWLSPLLCAVPGKAVTLVDVAIVLFFLSACAVNSKYCHICIVNDKFKSRFDQADEHNYCDLMTSIATPNNLIWGIQTSLQQQIIQYSSKAFLFIPQ